MKSIVVLFVALLMLVKPLWPIAAYIMNYDYISNVLCENKDKPELECDGKCYLADMLAKESEQGQKNPFNQKHFASEIQIICFFESLNLWDFGIDLQLRKQKAYCNSKVFISTLFTSDIAQPPELT